MDRLEKLIKAPRYTIRFHAMAMLEGDRAPKMRMNVLAPHQTDDRAAATRISRAWQAKHPGFMAFVSDRDYRPAPPRPGGDLYSRDGMTHRNGLPTGNGLTYGLA